MILNELMAMLGALEGDNICAASVEVYVTINGMLCVIENVSIHKHYNGKTEDKITIAVQPVNIKPMMAPPIGDED